jgi:predicted PhzF superfamily epimerase YddE/YHI9
VKGVVVTAKSAEGSSYDFISRYFAPFLGILEDPVTGTAHCALAPFWCLRLNRISLTGYQASARGGIVGVELKGDRVQLSGEAITILKGKMKF